MWSVCSGPGVDLGRYVDVGVGLLLTSAAENFAATMTNDEVAAWNRHFEWLGTLVEKGVSRWPASWRRDQ